MNTFIIISALVAVCSAVPDVHYAAPLVHTYAHAPVVAVAHAPAITSYSYETRQVHPGPAIAVAHYAAPIHHAPLVSHYAAHPKVLAAPLVHAPLAHGHLAHAPLVHAPLAHAPLAHAPLIAPYGYASPLAKTLLIKK